jgi:DNA gyrase subunit B
LYSQEQYLKDDQELNNYLLQEAVNDANLFTNVQAPAISGIALETAVKEGQQKYCETVYSRSGIHHMGILKNSKDLLDNLKSRSFSQVSSGL